MSAGEKIEEGTLLDLDFKKLGKIAQGGVDVLPVVIQDEATREVLLIAYVNEEALQLTIAEQRCVLYSTSRHSIWRKGETSGDVLPLVEIRVNCEQNSLLFLVKKTGEGACHTRGKDGKTRGNCYYRKIEASGHLEFVKQG
jgi:phosphoribosyl-AMP cyclohydrolase